MFERYTEYARRALFFARYEASQSGTVAIEAEQLLLGLMREGEREALLVTRLLGDLRIDEVRREFEGTLHEKISTSVEIPFSADTKMALKCAAEEADRLLHNYIGGEHLLLGLLRVEQSSVARFLTTRGVTLEGTRQRLVELLQKRELRRELSRAPGPVFSHDMPAAPAAGGTLFQVSISTAAKPDVPGGERGAPGLWTFSGTTLEQLLVILCECQRERLELPAGMDAGLRYDVTFSHAPEQPPATKRRLLLACVEAHFRISVTRETRAMDAWVMTAPNGPGPALKPVTDEHGAGVGHGSMTFVVAMSPDANFGYVGISAVSMSFGDAKHGQGALKSLSFPGATMKDLAEMLETPLLGPVVDETGLTGRYKIDVTAESDDPQESLRQLLEPLGLVMTRARRDVALVVVKQDH